MSWTKNLFCLAVVSVALAGVFAGAGTAETKTVQGRQPPETGVASLIANLPVTATLQVKAGKLPLKGRISAFFEISPEELKQAAITVRQFNLVFPNAPQAAISGRKAKTKTGVLGLSLPPSEKTVRLKYDAKSHTASGEIPVQAHFPQIDELFPQTLIKGGRESDFAVPRTQLGKVKLELRFAEAPDSAAARASKSKPASLDCTGSAQVDVEPLQDGATRIPGYVIVIRSVPVPIETAPIGFFEVAKRLCIQPVRVRTSARDGSPTGLGLAFGMPGATTEWNKADVVFNVQSWKMVTSSTLKVVSEGAEESSLRDLVNESNCIEVFFVENFSPEDLNGGGATWSSGTASAKVISSDGNATFGVDLTHLAHEFGHVIALGHPGDPNGLFDSSGNTLMCPSGWHNDNPRRNSRDNARNVFNPLFTFALKAVSATTDCNRSADCGRCPL